MLTSYDEILMRLHEIWRHRHHEFADLPGMENVPAFVRDWFAELAERLKLTTRPGLWGVDVVWSRTAEAARIYGDSEPAIEFPAELPLLLLDVENTAANAGAAFLRLANVGASFRVLVVIDDDFEATLNAALDARDSARLGGIITRENDVLLLAISPGNRESPRGQGWVIHRGGEREMMFL